MFEKYAPDCARAAFIRAATPDAEAMADCIPRLRAVDTDAALAEANAAVNTCEPERLAVTALIDAAAPEIGLMRVADAVTTLVAASAAAVARVRLA